MNLKKVLIGVISVCLLLGSIYLVLKRYGIDNETIYSKNILEKTYRNYGEEVLKAAKIYHLPPEYLLSLIALECSGRKLVPHRFEPKVFESLQNVQAGKLIVYDNVYKSNLKGLKNSELKKLASSWGPFQLMGYKSFELKTSVEEINGKKSINLGSKWIDKSYGNLLRANKFKDAFHIHNTGRRYPLIGPPRTYHKHYVPQGIKYMEAFKLKISEESGPILP